MTANYLRTSDAIDSWRDRIFSGIPPKTFSVGEGSIASFALRAGSVLLLGGAPGAGKTAFAMQVAIDAARLDETAKVTICNVEMPPETLFERQLSRISGVGLTAIRDRSLTENQCEKINVGIDTILGVADRLYFVGHPYTLENVAATLDACDANILVLDYIQRIAPPGKHFDRRTAVDASIDYLRQFASAGLAIVAVAAVARQKDARGRSTYSADSLTLASFRESSELEFGADDAYILTQPNNKSDDVVLKHLKARYSAPKDIYLRFVRDCQRFVTLEGET